MNLALITPAQADIYLADKEDWLDLDEDIKILHIEHSSVYVQTVWECIDVDWDDPLTIPDEVSKAVALYAYADLHNNLWGDVTSPDAVHGALKSQEDKVDVLLTKTEWYLGGSVTPSKFNRSLAYPDALMGTACTKLSSSEYLVRV